MTTFPKMLHLGRLSNGWKNMPILKLNVTSFEGEKSWMFNFVGNISQVQNHPNFGLLCEICDIPMKLNTFKVSYKRLKLELVVRK